LTGALSSPKVINLAFSDDVLVQGNNSELIETAGSQSLVLRVAEHEPAGVLSFEDNRALVEENYRLAKMAQTAAETGQALIAELQAGEKSLDQIASVHAWQLEKAEVVREDFNVPQEVVRSVFNLPPAANDASVHAGVAAPNGDYWLIEVNSVEGGSLEALEAAERPLVAEQFASQVATTQLNQLTRELRSHADVELKPIADE
jgi:peptidyl-prolyl cis-trans isomerase D